MEHPPPLEAMAGQVLHGEKIPSTAHCDFTANEFL